MLATLFACRQGHRRCPAPQICGETAVGTLERHELKLDAEAAARRLASTGQAQRNPYARGTRRNVIWTSYFLEAQMAPGPAGEPA